jgi:hypothetical protein
MIHPPPNRYCGWSERGGRLQSFVLRSAFLPGCIVGRVPGHCTDSIGGHAWVFGTVAGIVQPEFLLPRGLHPRRLPARGCRAEDCSGSLPCRRARSLDLGLVRSQDWTPISVLLGLKPESPAFTAVDRRETFLKEALFKRRGLRAAELQREWLMPRDQLLDLAVTHELGHALCSEPNEAVADRFGEELRRGHRPRCSSKVRGYTSIRNPDRAQR